MATIASLRMLSLGPAIFPVDVMSSVPAPVSLKTVCCGQTEPHAPVGITMPKVCEHCGEIANPASLRKAAKAGNEWVLVDSEKQAELTAKRVDNRKITLTPHPKEQVEQNTVPIGKSYWLKPSKNSDPAGYALLMDLVRSDPDHSYLTMWAVRTKPTMYELSVHGNALMLVERVHLSDANPAPVVDSPHPPQKDIDNMMLIAGSMSEPFTKEKYSDSTMSDLLADGQRVSLDQQGTAPSVPLSDLLAAMANELAAPPKPKRVRKPRTTTAKATP